ncbi:MAG: DUF1573 domain-containing protein [Bacteroidetes bacterium]|nr:DUF1573 domain-containing protein [Bacteroidota bacterium]
MKRIFTLALLLVGAASVKAQSSASLDPNAPVMEFRQETIEFGTITQGDKVTREFVFTNTGKQPLIITEVKVTCGCTDPQYPKTPIAPGKQGTITVTFNSAGKSGIQSKPITIVSNNRDGDVILHLKGEVKVPATTGAEAAPKQNADVKPAPAQTTPATTTGTAKPAPATASKPSSTTAKPSGKAAASTKAAPAPSTKKKVVKATQTTTATPKQ